ncbi:MAG: hypothetical protein HC915_21695 [Anaerolineae bacterium]|nr:hypothetical protein [Anaerolineae bacterium]
MTLLTQALSAETFWELLEGPEYQEKRFELVDGALQEMASPSPLPSVMAARIAHYLLSFVLPGNLGYVLGKGGGYAPTPENVRIPDVSFISRARYPTLPKRLEAEGGPETEG